MKEPNFTGAGVEARGLRADTIQFEPGAAADAPTEVSLSLADASPENQKKRDALILAVRAGKVARMTLRDVTFGSDDEQNERGYVFDKDEYGPFVESFAGTPFRKDHNESFDAHGGTVLRAWADKPDEKGRRWAKANIELDETWSMLGALTRKLNHFSFGGTRPEQNICTVCNGDFFASASHYTTGMCGGKKALRLCKGVRGKEISVVANPAYSGTASGDLLEIAADAGSDKEKTMNLARFAALVGLDEAATEDQVFEALSKKFAEPVVAAPIEETATVASIAEFVGLTATATPTEIKAAIMATTYRPDADADKDAIRELKAARRVDFWTKEKGKFTPAERDWAMAQALKDLDAFELYASKKPPAVPVGGAPAGTITGDGGNGAGIHADDKEEFGLELLASDEPLDDHERKVLRQSKGYMKPEKWLQIRRSDAKTTRRALAS